MTKVWIRSAGCLWLGVCVAAAGGQVSKPGTGTVTGHVICADAQRPARFANVMLFGVPASVSSALPKADSTDQAALEAAIKTQMSAMSAITYVQTQTAIDGGFVAENVPPGDYYVMASVAGYVQPRNLVQAAYDAGEDVTKGVTGVPIVHVSADRASEAEVSVSRGAAVEGHVTWDDGGAVNGAMVQVEATKKDHKDLPPQFAMMAVGGGLNGLLGITDDRGRYRISGLAPGDYTVKATLQTRTQMSMQKGRMNFNAMAMSMPLVVYAPGAFHKSAAKPVTLTSGEERTDADMTFNLNGTHTVSGRVTSAEDHHVLSEAQVTLKDANDKEFTRGSGLDADGNYNVTFVPPGTYTLEVSGGADTVPGEPTKGLVSFSQDKRVRSYENGKQQVMVTDSDVTRQNIELAPSKTVKKQMDIGGILGAVAGSPSEGK